MRIGLFVPGHGPDTGGGYTFVEDIGREMLRLEGADVILIGSDPEPPEWAAATDARYEVLPVGPTESRLLRTFDAVVSASGPLAGRSRSERLRAFVDDLGLNVVVALGPWAPIEKVPFVVTVWDLQHRVQPSFPEVSAHGERASRERLYSRILPRAARVIVGTDAGRREVQAFYEVPDAHIVRLPHPTPRFALEAPIRDPEPTLRRLGVEREGFVFYPAQFWTHKNHISLVGALAELRRDGWSVPAVFSGTDAGNLAAVLDAACDLGVSDLVITPGFVDRDTLIDLYRGAFALVYASLFGPENLPPLEAFALGCPVIAARVDGADEQLGDAATLVDGTDPAAIAAAMRRLKDPDVRETLRARGSVRARSWTSEDFASGLVAALADLDPVRPR